tara:strand:+ start:121 stop:324 length:204 start_codon:yes stop_codon:yes gene_type:complete
LNGLKVGDLVCLRGTTLNGMRTKDINTGIVIEVLDSEIYDKGERIIVFWQSLSAKSYEKESSLERLN